MEDELAKELKAFLASKAGVKGLVDSGLAKIPRIFIHPPQYVPQPSSQEDNSCVINLFDFKGIPLIDFKGLVHLPPSSQDDNSCVIPLIDFKGIPLIDIKGLVHLPQYVPKTLSQDENSCANIPLIDFKALGNGHRVEIIDQIRQAAQSWGVFQVINHGIPGSVMDDMLGGGRRFFEQPLELKKEWFSHDQRKMVRYFSRVSANLSVAEWRDSLSLYLNKVEEHQIPEVCRKCASEYAKYAIQVKDTISELLSEALGLNSDCLQNNGCMKDSFLLCNYYPPCPEPELTLGISSHSDYNSLTLLLQDLTGGLQILHQNKWMNVPTVPGALIANVGDLMQVITNDKFKSVVHRVVVNKSSSRISVAAVFLPYFSNQVKSCGPLKELLSEDNPPLYRETTFSEYRACYSLKRLDGLKLCPKMK